MKSATGPEAAYITSMAMTIAATMTSMSSAIPIAVMMESSENTRSMTISCMITRVSGARGEAAAVSACGSRASISPWISWVALAMRNKPPPMRIRSRQESSRSNRVTTGSLRPDRKVRPPSIITRNRNAKPRPICRARFARCSSRRDTRSEMKITLSTPSTISSAVSVTSAARHSGRSEDRADPSTTSMAVTGSPDKARCNEVKRDRAQGGGDPGAGIEIAAKGRSSKQRPDDEQHDVEHAPSRDPQRMDEREWSEGQPGEHDDRRDGDPWMRTHDEQIERGKIPQHGETAEAIVRHLHLQVGEIEHAGEHDKDAGRHGGKRRQQAAMRDRIGGNEDVRDEVDGEIQVVARPPRQHRRYANIARDCSIHPVDDQRGAEKPEHQRPVLLDGGDQRQQCERRARGGQHMHRKGARLSCGARWHRGPLIGCRRIAVRHQPSPLQSSRHSSAERPAKFQLRPKTRTRDVSAREIVTSGAIQYSVLRMMTFSPARLPRMGLTLPSMIFGIEKMRVSPSMR